VKSEITIERRDKFTYHRNESSMRSYRLLVYKKKSTNKQKQKQHIRLEPLDTLSDCHQLVPVTQNNMPISHAYAHTKIVSHSQTSNSTSSILACSKTWSNMVWSGLIWLIWSGLVSMDFSLVLSLFFFF